MRKKIFIILLILFLTFYVSQNLYQLNLIQGDSMSPTYKNMQFTLIDKRVSDFQRGDVIVFYSDTLNCTMVKRIIAASGDTVLISDGLVFVNNTPSPYTDSDITYAGTAAQTLVVGYNSFFVMGDNHAQSKDSRDAEIGCIPTENIIGRLIPSRLPRKQKPPSQMNRGSYLCMYNICSDQSPSS